MSAERTDPREKKTESAVTKYSFPFGMCSRRSVPSVGIEPWTRFNDVLTLDEGELTPTALPRKNRSTHRLPNEFANDARMPNKAVKKRVALKAALRPTRSEQVPQPIAPIIIPANMDEDNVPMKLSGTAGISRE